MLLSVGVPTQAFAQDVPAVFVHGIWSSGQAWHAASARLAQRVAIAPHAPDLPSGDSYETQAHALHAQLGGLPQNKIAIGHSNGGLVSRQWSRQHPLAGVVTIGTPHRGMPLLANVLSLVEFNYSGLNLVNAAFGAFTPGGGWWDVLLYAQAALGFAADVSWTSLGQLAAVTGYGAAHGVWPVLGQMHPASGFLADINSAGNLGRESADTPRRAGIAVVADNWYWAGPIRARSPAVANYAAPLLYSTAALLHGAGVYILTNADPADVDATRKAFRFIDVAGWLWSVDPTWCLAVSSPYMDRCEANDGLLPVSVQRYPGATNFDFSGPAHVQETENSDDILFYALTTHLAIRPRGTDPGPVLNGSDTLFAGRRLYPNEYVDSADGRFRLVYQGDGNLVLYAPGSPLWASDTDDAGWAEMQGDGNLVVYNSSHTPVWASNTSGHEGAYTSVLSDGNVVLFRSDGHPLWSTGTGGR